MFALIDQKESAMFCSRPMNKVCLLVFLISFPLTLGLSGAHAQFPWNARRANTLPDLSGLAWIDDDRFIGCHDAKVADENFRPRYASMELPKNLRGVTYRDARFSYKGVFPNDLESMARVPGKNILLFCESGDSKDDPALQKIFKTRVTRSGVKVVDVVNWPVLVHNVEATAVARVGKKYLFVFAERADNQLSTEVSWLELDPIKMKFRGKVQSVTYEQPNPERYNRVIVGLDIDNEGILYAVSAFDAEAAGLPNPDNGPYAGGIYSIGSIKRKKGKPVVELFGKPNCLGTVDGFKIESVAIREVGDQKEIFFGTDDENYGGVIRQLPAPVIE